MGKLFFRFLWGFESFLKIVFFFAWEETQPFA